MKLELARRHWYDYMMAPRLAFLISTMDKEGRPNAAPFSSVMPFSGEPPRVVFASRTDRHTLLNARETGEFVINVVPIELLRELMICYKYFDRGVNEIKEAGLTERKSKMVKVPSIEECILWIECKYLLEIGFAPEIADHNLVIGEVLYAECKDEFIKNGDLDIIRANLLLHGEGLRWFTVAKRALGNDTTVLREKKGGK